MSTQDTRSHNDNSEVKPHADDNLVAGRREAETEFGIGLLFSVPGDVQAFRKIMQSLKAAGVPFDYYAAAMYRDPGGVQQWAQFAEWRRLRVIIAAAGSEPALPWMAAELSMLPVVALPVSHNGRPPDLPARPPQVPVIMAPRDDVQMAIQLALRILALKNPRARTIIAAIHDHRANDLQKEIERMLAENDDIMTKAPPGEQIEMHRKMQQCEDALTEEIQKMNDEKSKLPSGDPAKEATPAANAKSKKLSKSKGGKAAKPKGEPETENSKQNPVKPEGKVNIKEIDQDFASYKEIFMEEINKIRVEVQHTRNPDQKKFEEEARREREAAKAGAGGKEAAPWRALRDHGGPIEGLVEVNPDQPQLEIIEAATQAIAEGAVIAIPTDTVYGLAVDATNADAVRKLYDLKGREDTKAIPLLIHSLRMLEGICPELPEDARKLAKAFWPGPLTLVVPRHEGAFEAVTSDATIGVRLPDHFVALSVISMVGRPLAVTSANPSGAKPAETGAEVGKYFGAKVKMILDAGPAPGGPVSTVVRMVEEPFEILREGKLTREQLERVIRGKMK